MKEKKSRTLSVKRVRDKIEYCLEIVAEDRVTVYAAQASFFIVISAIPFIMLLINVLGYLIPEGVAGVLVSMGDALPEKLRDLYLGIIAELYSRPAIRLISITAITAFWMASRGLSAVRGGLTTVYRSHPDEGFLKRILFSAVYTAAFMVILIVVIIAQLFGQQLYGTVTANFPGTRALIDSVFRFKEPIIFVFLTLFFTLLYLAVNRRGAFVRNRFIHHLPGAMFAAAGWMLFSFFYSLYTVYFSGVSYIYGSLTAVILLLLWMYVCMMILLLGAEVNKLLASRRKKNDPE